MDKIEIKIPADPKYLQLLRLSIASLASRAGFDIDDTEDLKVIITELATFIMPINEKIIVEFELLDRTINIIFKADEIDFIGFINEEDFKLKRQILMTLTDSIESTEKYIKISKNR